VENSHFSPYHATDNLTDPLYMGDYDVVTSDFTLTSAGFVGAFRLSLNVEIRTWWPRRFSREVGRITAVHDLPVASLGARDAPHFVIRGRAD
jgi:hypothetical protein